MGLLDRWSKKTQTERLEKTSEPKSESKAEAKPAAVKEVKKTTTKKAEVKKTATKKATTKKVAQNAAEVVEEKHDDHEGHDHAHEAPKLKKIDSKILLRALVTEKSAIKQSENKYSFIVANDANKAVIKKAVEEVYKVKPVSVNVINVQGKAMRFGQHSGKRSDFKKAVVTLPKGKTIVIHEGV